MQIKYPCRRFCRLDPIRDELSPQAVEHFDKLALFERLRREGGRLFQSQPCHWKRCFPMCGRAKIRAALARFEHFNNAYRPHQALGQMTPMQAYHHNFKRSALIA